MLGRSRSSSHHFHITCEQVATRAARESSSTREMMATSTDPIGETAAFGTSGKTSCEAMTEE